MPRKSKRDWLEAGLVALAENGVIALTIDALTKTLGVTKGSFYHHFKNQQDYKEQVLAFWEEEITDKPIQAAEGANTVGEVLDRIVETVGAFPVNPEPAIRAWAQTDETAMAFVQRVDERRVAYVQNAFLEHTDDDEARAKLISQLLYMIMTGADYIAPPLTPKERWQLYQEFKRIYGVD